jgi:D-3-phosphoglycerate dehydrogenase
MKVLISDKTEAVCARTLRGYRGIEVVERPALSPEELLQEVARCEGLVVRSATKVTRQLIAAGERLKVIGRAGAGVDNIDVTAARERGIVVMNTPGGNAAAVAELVIGMMLALARSIPAMDASMKAGRWEKKSYMGSEIAGKTLGLLGIGQVGSKVARKAAALEMRVLAYDPLVPADRVRELGAEPVPMEELLGACDFLSLHLPKTAETSGMIDAAFLSRMKKGVFLIQCARGGIVVEKDLVAALDSGRVAGAGIDVYEKEPPEDWRLARHPRVVSTPHVAASTREAQEVVAEMIARQIGDYLATGKILNAVSA